MTYRNEFRGRQQQTCRNRDTQTKTETIGHTETSKQNESGGNRDQDIQTHSLTETTGSIETGNQRQSERNKDQTIIQTYYTETIL